MLNTQAKNGRASSIVQGLVSGTVTSVVMALLASVGLAKLVDQEIIPWENIGYWIMAVLLLTAFSGSWTAYRRVKHQRLLVCFLSWLTYWLLLLGITALVFGGSFEAVPQTAGITFAGSMSAFLLMAPKRRPGSAVKKRIAHR